MAFSNYTMYQFSPFIVGCMRLGTWGANMSSQELETFIDACIDMDLVDFDHADIYGDYMEEGRFGQVIKRRSDLKNKIGITTKCGIKMVRPQRPDHKIKSYDTSKAHIIASAEHSLRELGVDVIDIYLIHRYDFLIDPNEIAEAFDSLKSSGKVKHFGVSNFLPHQFDFLNNYFPLVTNQVEISLFRRDAYEDGTLNMCLKHNIVPTAWSPFGGGSVFAENANFPKVKEVLEELQNKYSASSDQVLLAWLRKHPSGIVPILGTTKVHRLKSALGALEINLTREEWYQLWEAATGRRVA